MHHHTRPLAGLMLCLGLAGCAGTGGLRCDGSRTSDTATLSLADQRVVPLKVVSRYCSARAEGRQQVGSRKGLFTAEGRTLVPAHYNAIIPLNSTLSLVQRDNLNGKRDADDGWYLYQHGKGEQPRLPWDRFTVLTPRSLKPLPGVVIAVGEMRSADPRLPRQVGLVSTYMDEVKALPEVQGHLLEASVDWHAQVRGERRAVQLYRNHAVVTHGPDGSRMFNLQGEQMTPLMADIRVLSNGLDAVTPLMKTRHRDLPRPASAPLFAGETEDTVYLPLDRDGSLLGLPEGAAGVMWIPGRNRDADVYISGWAVVFPRGNAMEVAVGTGSVVDVLRRAESLPRYAGMSLGRYASSAYRLVLKLPETGDWMTVDSGTLRVDERSQRAASPATLWAQVEKEVSDKFQAQRQAVIDRNAEIERLRQEEARRRIAEGLAAEAELARIQGLADAGRCDYEIRRVLDSLPRDTLRRFLEKCGMYGAEDFDRAARSGVNAQQLSTARAEDQRRRGALEAQRARAAGTAALLNAMKYRGPDNNWAEVRVYDRNGIYQGTSTMTRSQAETIGAKPEL